MPIWTPWTSKPQPGTRINWTHPMARGLYALWACNENCGWPIELVTNSAITGGFTSSYSWLNGNFSPGASSAGFYRPMLGMPASCTVWFHGTTSVASGDGNRLLSTTDADSGVGIACNNTNFGGANSGFTMIFGGVAWLPPPGGNLTPPAGVPVFAAVAWDKDAAIGNYCMYRYDTGGVLLQSRSVTQTPGTGGTNITLASIRGAYPSGNVYYQAGIAARAWSLDEMAAFGANPWQLYEQPRSYFLMGGGAGSSSVTVNLSCVAATGLAGGDVALLTAGAASVVGSATLGGAAELAIVPTTAAVSSGTAGGSAEQATVGAASVVGGAAAGGSTEQVIVGAASVLGSGAAGGVSVVAGSTLIVSVSGVTASAAAGGASALAIVPAAAVVGKGITPSMAGGAFVADAFNGTSGTNLTTWNSDWVYDTTFPGSIVLTSAGRIRGNNFTWNLAYSSTTPPSADYDVSADLVVLSNTASTAVVGRLVPGANTYYWANWSGGSLSLGKQISGTTTTFQSGVTFGASGRVTLRMVGSQISLLVNGVLAAGPYTDSSITAAGYAGVRLQSSVTDTTGCHLDNYQATASGVSGGTVALAIALAAGLSGATAIGGETAQASVGAASVLGSGAAGGVSVVAGSTLIVSVSGVTASAAAGGASALAIVPAAAVVGSGASGGTAEQASVGAASVAGSGTTGGAAEQVIIGAASTAGSSAAGGVSVVAGSALIVSVSGVTSSAAVGGAAELATVGAASVFGAGTAGASSLRLSSAVAAVSVSSATGGGTALTIVAGRSIGGSGDVGASSVVNGGVVILSVSGVTASVTAGGAAGAAVVSLPGVLGTGLVGRAVYIHPGGLFTRRPDSPRAGSRTLTMSYKVPVSSSSYPLRFLLVSADDHISAVTGATPTVTILRSGDAAFAPPSGAVSELGNGWYQVAGNALDTAKLGPLQLHATADGADPCDDVYEVVPGPGPD